MAMNFPAAPAEGAIYAAPGGPTYKFTSGLWVPQAGSGVFLEKANNLSDLTDAYAARTNLGVGGWRTLWNIKLSVASVVAGFSIPTDVSLVRATVKARVASVNDQNLVMQWGNAADGSNVEGGANYAVIYDWVNGATPAQGVVANATFIVVQPPGQSGVFGISETLIDPGEDSCFLANAISRGGATNGSGVDGLYNVRGRSGVAGRKKYIRFLYQNGVQALTVGSHFIIEGLS